MRHLFLFTILERSFSTSVLTLIEAFCFFTISISLWVPVSSYTDGKLISEIQTSSLFLCVARMLAYTAHHFGVFIPCIMWMFINYLGFFHYPVDICTSARAGVSGSERELASKLTGEWQTPLFEMKFAIKPHSNQQLVFKTYLSNSYYYETQKNAVGKMQWMHPNRQRASS